MLLEVDKSNDFWHLNGMNRKFITKIGKFSMCLVITSIVNGTPFKLKNCATPHGYPEIILTSVDTTISISSELS